MAVDDQLRAQGKCGFIRVTGARIGEPCEQSAGHGTEHVGEGCCSSHGGNGGRPAVTGERIGEGKYKRYDVLKSPTLRALNEHFEADPDPLNLLPEILLLRTMITDFAERHAEFTDALIAWYASFSKEYRAAEARADENGEEAPDPGDYATKPRKVIDILQVGRFIVEIGNLADKIQKQRLMGAISIVEANAFWDQLAFEFVRGARETVDDEDVRSRLIQAVQGRWDKLPPPGAGTRIDA